MTRRTARRSRRAQAPGPLILPVVTSKIRIFGLVTLCAKVALVPLAFDRAADLPFSVGKAILSHALAYVLLAVLVALVQRFGRSFLRWSPLHLVVLAFLAVNAVATVFAVDPLLALYGTHGRMLGLGTIADGVVLYFAVVLLVSKRSEAIAVVASALGASVIVLLYEAVQLAGRDPFAWNVSGAVRPFSALGQTTSLAEYLGVFVIGTITIAAFAQSVPSRLRSALLLYSGLLFAGLVATQTRSGLVGVITGAALLVGLTWLAHPNPRARIASLGGALAATAALVLVLAFTPLGGRVLGTIEISSAAEGDEGTGPHLEQSADVRVAFYKIAFEILRERPALGYGPDNFVVGVPKYRTETEPFEVQQSLETSAHGWLSQVAATSGLVGLGTFLAIVLTGFAVTVRAGYRPGAWLGAGMLAGFLGAGLTTVNGLGTEWLFWTSIGAIGAATARPWPSPELGESRSRPGSTLLGQDVFVRSLIGYFLIGGAVVIALTSVNALDAARSAQASLQARLSGQNQQAIDLALRATSSDPRRSAYWDALGLAYIGAGRTSDAAGAFKRATDLAPYDFRYSGDLARAYAELAQRGDPASSARARDVAEHAVKTDPNNPLSHLTRAIVMQITGDLPEAVRSAERAMALDQSNNPAVFLTAIQVYFASGRFSDAIAVGNLVIGEIGPAKTVAIRVELARALAANGQPLEALAALDAALAISPNEPAALQLRAEIRARPTP